MSIQATCAFSLLGKPSSQQVRSIFESKRCQADGKYVFTSTQGLTSGIKRFPSPHTIKSMIISKNHNYTHHPLAIHFNCHYHELTNIADANDTGSITIFNASYELTQPGDEESFGDGGLSSNWRGALPAPSP
ncbi:unnamed protein product [Phytophthora lilii]|uniref:Unnamed protein product n=1 Tax=Phytophthora lilii TaxID=2077276 RepID=A0A9W6WUS0_9STRA|nr:unnamed protein product [Phytophthora lilii]